MKIISNLMGERDRNDNRVQEKDGDEIKIKCLKKKNE